MHSELGNYIVNKFIKEDDLFLNEVDREINHFKKNKIYLIDKTSMFNFTIFQIFLSIIKLLDDKVEMDKEKILWLFYPHIETLYILKTKYWIYIFIYKKYYLFYLL